MIVSFSFENWMSFRDKVTISAVAGKQVRHIERVPWVRKYKIHILPVIAIYGGNASGKSNILKALEFAQGLVVEVKGIDEEIDVRPFLLSPEFAEKPSRFWFELLINEKIYDYSFSVTRKTVCEEKLVEIRPASERTLFERKQNNRFINHGENKYFEYVERSTRKNQLFLTSCMLLNVKDYEDVYEWFKYGLDLVSPEAIFGNLENIIGDKKSPSYKWVNSMLGELDTNIVRLDSEDVKDADIKKWVKKDPSFAQLLGGGERYFTQLEKGETKAKRLVLYHKGKGDEVVKFSGAQESDGTMRLLELLPAFLACKVYSKAKGETGVVYFVDELDRSIHYLLLHRLLENMLSSCNADSRSQLIFTTHDLLLMDQELFRRDEILFVERDDFGVSSVIPLNEYRGVRLDKDIRKSYLQGRFGGIPKI
jgi:AAA15 family ATPase/GTPase